MNQEIYSSKDYQYFEELRHNTGLMCALKAIANAFDVLLDGPNPFNNNGATYDGKVFRVHAYNWNDDEEQPFNFAWRNVRVRWYKYLGRSMTVNRFVTNDEAKELLLECIKELLELNAKHR